MPQICDRTQNLTISCPAKLDHLTDLAAEIKRTEELIRNHISNHPTLKQQSELLDSIPGVGRTTAALLLAEIVDMT